MADLTPAPQYNVATIRVTALYNGLTTDERRVLRERLGGRRSVGLDEGMRARLAVLGERR